MQLVAEPFSKGFRKARTHSRRPQSRQTSAHLRSESLCQAIAFQAPVLLKGASPNVVRRFTRREASDR
jgi:hypothetical protein